jgi:hypothetical protein
MERLRYLQTGSSRAPRTNAEGRERTKTPAVIETRTVSKKEDTGANSSSAASAAGPCPYPEKWQDRFTVKFTWDSRTLGKKMHQTEGMLLIIPHGQEGRLYCQSALRIRTVIVYTGKDSKELVQANFSQILEELEDVREHGLRYTATEDTFLKQVDRNGTKAPLKSGDRDVAVELVLPSDMAAHVGLLGHGGIRDSNQHFCTNCTCCKTQRHTPLRLMRVDADVTVGELAEAHGMPTNLLLAMNTGRDPSGMFPAAELTERILSYKTLPLPRGRQPPPAVVDPAAATAAQGCPAQVAPGAKVASGRGGVNGTGASTVNLCDRMFARPPPKKKKPRAGVVGKGNGKDQQPASAPVTTAKGSEQAEPSESTKQDMDWNAAIGGDESRLSGDAFANKDTVVHAGSIVRVICTFKVDRQSELLKGKLNLDQHR